MNVIDDSQILDLPECDTSLIDDESIGEENFSRYLDNSDLLCSESASSDESLPSNDFLPTWNATNGFRRIFNGFNGEAPDYRSNEKLPLRYFYQFCSRSMISKITIATNKYAAAKEIALNATLQEIEQYIRILLHMGIVQMSDYRMYWAPQTRYPPIADVFTRKRFDLIKSNFHISDNSQNNYGSNDFDRLFKVRDLYDHVQVNCKKLHVPEYLSIGL
jgi:hypothetical protein